MIKVPLPDGRTARFPDGTPAGAIKQAIEDYLDETPALPDRSVESVKSVKIHAPDFLDPAPLEIAPLEPASSAVVVVVPPRIRIEPYTADDDSGLGELATRLPEYAPAGGICRSVLERSRLPAQRERQERQAALFARMLELAPPLFAGAPAPMACGIRLEIIKRLELDDARDLAALRAILRRLVVQPDYQRGLAAEGSARLDLEARWSSP